jgi:flagellar motor component MotA
MQICQSQNEITLDNKLPIGLRLLIGSVGLVILLFAGQDFLKALGSFSIASLFIVMITGFGVLMGSGAIIAAIFAFDTQWKIKFKSIKITAKRGDFCKIVMLDLENIRKSSVLEIDTDSGSEFAIEMICNDGKRHISPRFKDKEMAQYVLNFFNGAVYNI